MTPHKNCDCIRCLEKGAGLEYLPDNKKIWRKNKE